MRPFDWRLVIGVACDKTGSFLHGTSIQLLFLASRQATDSIAFNVFVFISRRAIRAAMLFWVLEDHVLEAATGPAR